MSTKQEDTTAMLDTAESFFDACESGKGWDACRPYCHPEATFSAQAGPLSDIETVEEYTGWMEAQYEALPDIEYNLKSLAVDEDRRNVCACAVLRGTHRRRWTRSSNGRKRRVGVRLLDAVSGGQDRAPHEDLECPLCDETTRMDVGGHSSVQVRARDQTHTGLRAARYGRRLRSALSGEKYEVLYFS